VTHTALNLVIMSSWSAVVQMLWLPLQLDDLLSKNSTLWSLDSEEGGEDEDGRSHNKQQGGRPKHAGTPASPSILGGAPALRSVLRQRLGRRERREDDKGQRAAAGWLRAAGNLTHAVIYRAGHMVRAIMRFRNVVLSARDM
jgi:hypothetical protein